MRTAFRLLALYRPFGAWLAAGIGLNLVVILANVGLLALSGWFIAAMALAGLGVAPIEYFAPAAAIRGLAILRTASRYGERLVTHEATLRMLAALRVNFYSRLEPLAPARLQYRRGGDLLGRIRSDIDSLDNLYLRVVVPVMSAAIGIAVLTALLALFSPPAAAVNLGGLALAGVVLPLVSARAGREPGKRAVALRGELRAVIAENLQGMGELLMEGAQERRADAAAGLTRALLREGRRQAWIGAAGGALSGVAAQCALVGSVLVAIPPLRAGALPPADLAMIALFVLGSFEAVAPLPAAFGSLGETMAAARRLFELTDAEPAVAEPPPAREAPRPRHFDIRFRGVRMRYGENAPWALDGINLDVPEGAALGIVGPSGAGKTSLLHVLLRFWDYAEGSVQIGGTELRDLRGETARSLFSVVAQHTHLFNATIRENLLLARPGATDAELRAALRDANLLDEVLQMPAGLDAVIGERGARLSGGQARRLAIARAHLKDAPILLLDEPTEGLDPQGELAVLKGLALLMRRRTTVLISHRPQALRDVQLVVHIEAGRAVEGAWSRAQPGTDIFRPDPVLGIGR